MKKDDGGTIEVRGVMKVLKGGENREKASVFVFSVHKSFGF